MANQNRQLLRANAGRALPRLEKLLNDPDETSPVRRATAPNPRCRPRANASASIDAVAGCSFGAHHQLVCHAFDIVDAPHQLLYVDGLLGSRYAALQPHPSPLSCRPDAGRTVAPVDADCQLYTRDDLGIVEIGVGQSTPTCEPAADPALRPVVCEFARLIHGHAWGLRRGTRRNSGCGLHERIVEDVAARLSQRDDAGSQQ